jgi:hypothetical protein
VFDRARLHPKGEGKLRLPGPLPAPDSRSQHTVRRRLPASHPPIPPLPSRLRPRILDPVQIALPILAQP